MYLRNAFVFIATSWLLLGCGAQSASPPEAPAITRQQLGHNLRSVGKLLYVYGTSATDAHADLLALGHALTSSLRRYELILRPDTAVSEAELRQYPLMLVGSPEGHQHLSKAFRQLPLRYQSEKGNFRLAGNTYSRPDDVLMLSLYPSPWNDSLPIFVMTARHAHHIATTLQQHYATSWRRFLYDRWGYEVFQKGQRSIMGQFTETQAHSWRIDWDNHWDLSRESQLVLQSAHATFWALPEAAEREDIVRLSQQFEAATQRLVALSGKEAPKKLRFQLYPGTEYKGLKTGRTDQVHTLFAEQEVHAVIRDEFRGHESERPYELLAHDMLGKAACPALQTGLATYLTTHWHQQGYAYWLARLAAADAVPSLAVLLDPEQVAVISRPMLACMAGGAVDFLISRLGPSAFIRQYPHWQPTASGLAQLEAAWQEYLASVVAAHPPRARVLDAPEDAPNGRYKGFNFAHEGYRIHDGYLSTKAGQSMDALRSLHANSVAIVPYSYLRDPQAPSPLPIPTRAGSENDESVIRAAYMARQRGMYSMLKPQLWVHGAWLGDVNMQTEADWDAFFQHYESWITHYALMAEMYEMDLFCVGVEFVKASQHRPEAWKQMVRRLRHIYQGPFTYAANWGEEFERTSIWSELDYIGIDCYYPLSEEENPSDQTLRQNFESVLDKVEQVAQTYQKPVIFTEIGFRSVRAAWKQPHEAEGDKAMSLDCQYRCYRAVAEALEDESWYKGIFWWKWPSYLDYRGKEDRGFAPNDKPASRIVQAFFKETP